MIKELISRKHNIKMVNSRIDNYKYEIGQIYKFSKKDYMVLDRKTEEKRIKTTGEIYRKKYYYCECMKCGNKKWHIEKTIDNNSECKDCYDIRTTKWHHDINAVVKDDHRDITIISRYVKNMNGVNQKWYGYHCNICGYNGDIHQGNLDHSKRGCSCCGNKTVVIGVNDIATTDKWILPYLHNKTDGFLYSSHSHKHIDFECIECHNINNCSIISLTKYNKYSCPYCGDGFSMPEKVIYNLLYSLDIDFKYQLTKKDFAWIGKYRYDFYLPYYNCIIETHGLQHYKDTNFFRTFEEVQENDTDKKNVAMNNNIDKYIVLDCSKSDIDYIKNSIYNSELKTIFDLSSIDWNYILNLSNSSLMVKICDFWNSNKNLSTSEIGTIFKLDRHTIYKYLKDGAVVGLCDYNKVDEKVKRTIKTGKMNSKEVEVFKDNVSFGVYKSAIYLSQMSKVIFGVEFSQSKITSVCRGVQKTHKGFTFKYTNN